MLAPLRGKHANRGTALQHKTARVLELDDERSRESFACLPRKAGASRAQNSDYDVVRNPVAWSDLPEGVPVLGG
jgi:hypothetical protein